MRASMRIWLSNDGCLMPGVEQLLWLGCTVHAVGAEKKCTSLSAHCPNEITRISASMIVPHVIMHLTVWGADALDVTRWVMSWSKQGSLEPERYSRTRAVRNRRPKDPHNPSQKSLQRWDNEGGATKRGHDRREDSGKEKAR